jgi:hypothetical protein
MSLLRPNRRTPAGNGRADDGEPVDLGRVYAEQAAARAAASAAAVQAPASVGYVAAIAQQRAADPLARLLDALTLRPLRRGAFPPAVLVAEFDVELARLLDEADAAHGDAIDAAFDYQNDQPFARALVDGDVDAIADAVTVGRARMFAAAYVAQRDALAADDAVRAYAAAASTLIDELDHESDRIRDEIRELWFRARDRAERRALEDGRALCDRWRDVKRLWDWCRVPTWSFSSYGFAGPGELEYLLWEADAAVTGQAAPIVPGEALSLPGAPPPSDEHRRTR